MQSIRRSLLFLSLAMLAPWTAASGFGPSGLELSELTATATRPGQPNGAAHLTIRNRGGTADRLTGFSVDPKVAARGELHTMRHENGMMIMREVAGLTIGAGEVLRLSPGGDHLMLIGLKETLSEGQRVAARLHFEKAGSIDVFFAVVSPKPATGKMPHHHQ